MITPNPEQSDFQVDMEDGDYDEDIEDLLTKEASFVPPDSVSSRARQGLELREKFSRGGTQVGISRARDLKNKKGIPVETLSRMVSFFTRHAIDSDAKGSSSRGFWGNNQNPSNGWIAWLLWGGDEGFKWAWNKLISVGKKDPKDMPKHPKLRSLLNKTYIQGS
jgi:hypothetical protein